MSTKAMLAVIAGLIVILAMFIYWTDRAGVPTPPEGRMGQGPVSYDGVVYFFDSRIDFGVDLSRFAKAHPELRIVSVAPLDNVGHGATRGYWVVVEPRKRAANDD